MLTYLQELSSSTIDLSQSHSSTRTKNVFRRNWTSFLSSSPFFLFFPFTFDFSAQLMIPAIKSLKCQLSLFHINRNFGSTAGDILVFVYSRCWKTCLTFFEHVFIVNGRHWYQADWKLLRGLSQIYIAIHTWMTIIFKIWESLRMFQTKMQSFCWSCMTNWEWLVAVDDLLCIRNKHIIGWGHTDQMRKLSAANASGQSSDLTGAHCAQQGRPSGPAPAQPRRSSQKVLHGWFVKK